MEVTQEILLPVLLAAIVANAVILGLVLVAARLNRRTEVGPAARSALQGSLMSTSYIDRSGPSAWSSNGESAGGVGDGATEAVGEPVDAGIEPDPDPIAESEGIDALTGLLDHAAFTRLVVAEDLRVHRYHRPATVVIFELGGLDRLIDRLGVEAADRVVPALADTMRRLARNVDQVARLAPGRFGVLLPETDEVTTINYVERVRRACELWLESGAIALTLAAGWAGTDGDPTLIEAQRLATERMYTELRRDARKAADR